MKEKGRRLTTDDIRALQLEMMDEIDAFCRANGIRYALAFGTMLGAIRHKGFIPWDDDMDIIMPLEDMMLFKKKFQSNTIQYLDIDTCKHYDYHFSRVAHLATFSKDGLAGKSYGVNIDLYPVVGMPDTEEEIRSFLKSLKPLYAKRMNYMKWKSRAVRFLPVTTIPHFDEVIRQFRDIVLYRFPYEGAKNYLHAGDVTLVDIFSFDVFENLIDVEFEGRQYKGVGRYHDYLTHCYGDYMQLPPEDQRVPYHGGAYYWK